MKDICRQKEDLTFEYLQKIKDWVKSLTWQDFHDCRYEKDKKEKLKTEKKLETVQCLGEVIYFGNADAEKVIRYNEIFIVDSKYSKGNLCICEHVKGKKGHKVLYEIAKNCDYKNYSQGYFAVPILD